jgi:hypothetical protein
VRLADTEWRPNPSARFRSIVYVLAPRLLWSIQQERER